MASGTGDIRTMNVSMRTPMARARTTKTIPATSPPSSTEPLTQPSNATVSPASRAEAIASLDASETSPADRRTRT